MEGVTELGRARVLSVLENSSSPDEQRHGCSRFVWASNLTTPNNHCRGLHAQNWGPMEKVSTDYLTSIIVLRSPRESGIVVFLPSACLEVFLA